MGGVREFLGYEDAEHGAGARFEKYCAGGSKGWLLDNREHVVDIGPGIFGFDFTDIIPREGQVDDGACTVAAAVIMHQLAGFMDGRRIAAFFDECRFYMQPLKRMIEDYALTGRKKELMCWLVAQQPEHFTDSDIGMSLVAQCRTKVVFPDANYDDDNLRKLKLSEPAIRQIKTDMTMGKGRRFLLWRNDEPVICEYDLTGLPQLSILSGRPGTIRLMDRIRAEQPTARQSDCARGVLSPAGQHAEGSMKRILLATTIAASIFGAASASCRLACDRSVSSCQWAKELQQQAQQLQAAVNTLNQVEQQVRDIEDIPQGLMSQVTGLISQATQNPLTGITGNLSGLFNGSGTGSCANSANLLRLNQFATATGGDFTGSWINGAASITSGLQACNQMVLQSTQTSLSDLPQLGGATPGLQGCGVRHCREWSHPSGDREPKRTVAPADGDGECRSAPAIHRADAVSAEDARGLRGRC